MNQRLFECQRDQIVRFWKAGWTKRDIARRLEISETTVSSVVQGIPRDEIVVETRNCPYPGIRKYLIENRMTFQALASRANGAPSAYVVNALRGSAILSKRVIDAVLDATGLTYEEAFRE